MKKVKCSYKGCSDRRAHFDNPDKKRKTVTFDVPDDQKGPYFCSLECYYYYLAEKQNNNKSK